MIAELEQVKIAAQTKQVLELRLKGWTYVRISKEVGIGLATVNRYMVNALEELKEQNKLTFEQYVTQELARLDALMAAFWDSAIGGNTRSADIVLKAIKQRCTLLKLEVPDTIEAKDNTIHVVYATDWKKLELGTVQVDDKTTQIEIIEGVVS